MSKIIKNCYLILNGPKPVLSYSFCLLLLYSSKGLKRKRGLHDYDSEDDDGVKVKAEADDEDYEDDDD